MPQHNSKPTRRQLRHLLQLAEQTGTTFTPPATSRQASAEIDRLRKRSRSGSFERRDDRQAIARGLVHAAAGELGARRRDLGYGSSATWK
jgi:hypothetical protein